MIEVGGDQRTLHLDIGDAVVVKPVKEFTLRLGGFQADGTIEPELLDEELIGGDRLAFNDRQARAGVGGDDGRTRCRRVGAVEPVGAAIPAHESVGLEIGHQALGGQDDRAAGQTHATAGADPGPEDLVHRGEIPALEEIDHPHGLLHRNGGTRHPHAVRGEEDPGGVASDETILLGEPDDLGAAVEDAPPLRELIHALAGAGHDDRSYVAHLLHHRVAAGHAVVVVDVVVLTGDHAIEEGVVDVLRLHDYPCQVT